MDKESNTKIFNDPIHGNIQLPSLCVKIIDTPEFQRLRFIKQLGGVYFVYPGAAHNRFEHSIGTCHLAGRLVKTLQYKQPELDITPVDVLCVEIAALCHDLGHGPFSHLFDAKVIPQLQKGKGKQWKHEQGSIDMFRYMLQKNNELRKVFRRENVRNRDLTFIEEMIIPIPKDPEIKNWQYKGRPKKKGFLYEIVSNKRNGIDVDKWDYFARDCYMLGIGNNFNYNRCIDFSRVIDVDGIKQICFRDKEAGNLYDMFHTRYLLHQRAYQHKTNNIIERMLAEALVEANAFIELHKENGETCKMLEAVEDDNMDAYRLLTDDVIFRILVSTDTSLEKSQNIIKRVLRRDLYQFVAEERFAYSTFEDENAVEQDIRKVTGMNNKNIIIDVVNLNYGKKDKNPIDEVNFYNKWTPDEAKKIRKEDVSFLLPAKFAEQLVRVYSRNKNKRSREAVKKVYDNWISKTDKRNKNENGKRKATSEEEQDGQRKKRKRKP